MKMKIIKNLLLKIREESEEYSTLSLVNKRHLGFDWSNETALKVIADFLFIFFEKSINSISGVRVFLSFSEFSKGTKN
jgi:hypothetical protein